VLFCATQGGLPLAARGPVVVALSCQRPVHFERAHWAHLCSLSNYLLTSRAPQRAKEYSAWSQFFTNEQAYESREKMQLTALFALELP
jgi:hypothetical protein